MDIIDKGFFLENCQELNEIYVFSFFRIIKEVRFPDLKIYFKDSNGDLVCVSDVTIYLFLIFNSMEKVNTGYLMAEECENVIGAIIGHLAWLYGRDLSTRTHQSVGAKNTKQKFDSDNPLTNHFKATTSNHFPNSVNPKK